jgi:hypothetical protein
MVYWFITTFISPISDVLLVLGASGLLAVSFPLINQYLPFVNQYATVVRLASIAMLVLGAWSMGSQTERDKYALELEKQKVHIAELEKKASEKTVEVVTKYVETVKVVKEKGDVIREKVPVYITKEDDARCVIPNGFVIVHNSAVQNRVPEGTGNPNEGTSGVELSEATKVIVDNYNKYHEVVEQLRALQKWVREMEKNYKD